MLYIKVAVDGVIRVGVEIKGAFFWDYSVYSYFGIGITEYTKYQFPIKQIARYSEQNSWRDQKDRCERAIFPPKYYSVHSAIGSRMNGIAFRSFWNRNSSQKNTSTAYSGIGINGIVPKERALSVIVRENRAGAKDRGRPNHAKLSPFVAVGNWLGTVVSRESSDIWF